MVSVAGPRREAVVGPSFHSATGKKLADLPLGRIAFGRWGDATSGEEVVLCKHPQAIEIHCHGGIAASAAICESLAKRGCNKRDATDWYAAEPTSLIASEAHHALSKAVTERAALVLLDQQTGALDRAIDACLMALDSGDDAAALRQVKAIADRWPLGKQLSQPAVVALTGPPNVGKSSLINALVGYERAIVFDSPGTTRDAVTAVTAIDGWAVQLVDTAGLRTTQDDLEQAGIDLAQQTIATAELALVVNEAADWLQGEPPATDFDGWLEDKQVLHVANKIDRLSPRDCDRLATGQPTSLVLTSATDGTGIDELLEQITGAICPCQLKPGDAVPFELRHYELLSEAITALEVGDSAAAKLALLALAGA